MQKISSRQRNRSLGALVRPTGALRPGQEVPDRGKIADHAQMNLPEKVALERIVQVFNGFARRLHVQRIASFQRAVDGVAAAPADTFGGAANLLQRPEKAEIGGICHRICLSLGKPAPVYRGRP